MSPRPRGLRAVFAPFPNCNDIPTINICSHEVPLPAYWRIAELLHDGVSQKQIVGLVVPEGGGVRTRRSVEDVVAAIAENQRLMVLEQHGPRQQHGLSNKIRHDGAVAENGSNSHRLSTLLLFSKKNPNNKRFSVYSSRRASARLDVHPELDLEPRLRPQLQPVEVPPSPSPAAMLEAFQAQEKEQLDAAMALAARRKEVLRRQSQNQSQSQSHGQNNNGKGPPAQGRRLLKLGRGRAERDGDGDGDGEGEGQAEDERRRTIADIDHEIKKTLQRHAEIETQIEYARRLTVMR